MSGSVNRVTRMRTLVAPFSDSFGRTNLEDTPHPWFAPVTSEGRRYEIVSNRMAIPTRTTAYAFLKLPSTVFDVTFTFALGNGTNGSAGNLQLSMFEYDPTEDPSNAPDRYLFAVGTSVNGYTLYRNPPSFVYSSGGGALTRGSSYTGRLVYDGMWLRLYIGGALVAQEITYFTPSSRQRALRFISDDESNWFDDITITTPAGVSAVVDDPFSRTGATLGVAPTGQAWTALSGSWSTSGSQALVSTNAVGNVNYAILDSGTANGTISVDLPVFAVNPGICFRVTDVNNLYVIDCGTGAVDGALFKRVGGAYTSLGTFGAGVSGGDTVAVALAGSSITVQRVRGGSVTTLFAVTDATFTTQTKHGLYSNNTATALGNRFDNFRVAA